MDKQEALKRLTAMEKEQKELRAIIEAPDKPLNPIYYPKLWDSTYVIGFDGLSKDSHLKSVLCMSSDARPIPVFRTKQAADAFADAFNVMLELRACDGVVPHSGNYNWGISIDINTNTVNIINIGKYSCFTPRFKDRDSASNAFCKVGRERILKAFKTLAGIYA